MLKIDCKVCDEIVEVTSDEDCFTCTKCGTHYDGESPIINDTMGMYYAQLYEGEKRAGLVKDKDGNYV